MAEYNNRHIFKVKSASLVFEAHGLLMVVIDVEYLMRPFSQGIGGFILSTVNDDRGKPAEGLPHAADYIIGMLNVFDCRNWNEIPGKLGVAIWEGKDGDDFPLNTMPLGLAPTANAKGREFMFDKWQAKVRATEAMTHKLNCPNAILNEGCGCRKQA